MDQLPPIFTLVRFVGEIIEKRLRDEKEFNKFFFFYIQKKIRNILSVLETQKDMLVHVLLMKRGRYNRALLHTFTLVGISLGVFAAPFIADTFPGFSSSQSLLQPASAQTITSISADTNVFTTQASSKPRDSVISYTVEHGDTLSTIATKFGISVNTIKWANDMTDDTVTVGDQLKILPVTGVLHKVVSGDTVYTIAKKYNTDAQKIVNFPFNDFANPETFSLVVGEVLVVPDGIQPADQATVKRDVYVIEAPVGNVVPSGGYHWPLYGTISQMPIWYHMAVDIAVPIGTPIHATKDGIVKSVNLAGWNYGYALDVIIDHGGGMSSLYAHMSQIFVRPGDHVIGGQTVIGLSGNTGNSTGPHLHFEIRKNNITQNPLSYLK